MSEDPSDAYQELMRRGPGLGSTPAFDARSAEYAAGAWRYDDGLLSLLPDGISGKVVIDFGAKYGHLIPLAFARGAKTVIAADVEDEYLAVGSSVLSTLYPESRHIKTEQGFVPLDPCSVDVVITNEVISHINPMFLETYYSELARILVVGGSVLISDGNNWANEGVRAALPDVWDAWENGPQGRTTNRDVVTKPYVERRRNIIVSRHPALPPNRVDYLARNTSGLFGDHLARTIDRYVETGELAERPYRYGQCPTNPGPSGVVMERAFMPCDIVRSLADHGIDARQVFHPQYAAEIARLQRQAAEPPKDTTACSRRWFDRWRGTAGPARAEPLDLSGAFSMFQVLGTKASRSWR